MTTVYSYIGIATNEIFNFHGNLGAPTSAVFDDDINITYNGIEYEDRLTLTWLDGTITHQGIFVGSGLTVNANTELTGGTVESYVESTINSGNTEDLYRVEGLDLLAVDVQSAANSTSDVNDDRDLFGASIDEADVFLLGNYNDRAYGGGGSDSLWGFSGNDILFGGQGDDSLYGGNGADILMGGSEVDYLSGGYGRDVMNGGSGDDILAGDGGNDRMSGGTGNDDMLGGTGSDLMKGKSGNDFLYGGRGSDTLIGGGGNDLMWGEFGNNKIFGNSGNDRMLGGSGRDAMKGGSGNDQMVGDFGNDRISGQSGRDKIAGSEGNDILTGGSGTDQFFFKGDWGYDRITDFNPRKEKLFIEGIVSVVDAVSLPKQNFQNGVQITVGTNKLFLEGLSSWEIPLSVFEPF